MQMFSASAVTNFLACHHITALESAEARGEIKKPFFNDPAVDLLRKLGLEHEQRFLGELAQKNGSNIVQIDIATNWERAAAETLQALQEGAGVVYQATFLNGIWRGRADFLLRVDKRSMLGSWSYEPVETKLARRTKAGAIIQLCFYSELLSRIQGVDPQWMHVVLGGGAVPERFPVHHYIAYFRKIKNEFENAWKLEANPYPEPVEHCDVCSWSPVCNERWRDDDYISLVAGITRNQRKQLGERGISTVVSLAQLKLPIKPKIQKIGNAALVRTHEQAGIQVRGREEHRMCYELLEPVEAERGLCILPPPSPGDVFLDLEANPYVLNEGLEYLIGFLTLDSKANAEPTYESLWSFDRAEEKCAFETFIGRMMERRRQDPAMHIYHYASYEPTAMKRLAGRHGACIDELDELLRAGMFVDLYRAVRQGLRASVESYSIKRLEPLYSFTRTVQLREANVSLSSFEAALALGGGRQEEIGDLLQVIEGYNRDDCVSTFMLRNWLEDRRTELETRVGRALPRPAAKSGEAEEEVAEQVSAVRTLMARLVANLPEDKTEWNREQRALWLLAQLLEYHRREKKSAWWEYYRFCDLSDDELQEDNSALGGLSYVGPVGRVKRSIIHRYGFPQQEYAIDRAPEIRDPKTRKRVEVTAIDEVGRTVDIQRGENSTAPHPTALIPYEIIKDDVLRASLFRLGSWVADHTIAGGGQYKAARDLLLREPPHALKEPIGTLVGEEGSLNDAAKDLVISLAKSPSVLPIQGPPGSGKTFTGSRMIVELVKNRRRVGIAAVSHKVISSLLGEACKHAAEIGVSLRAVQKPNASDGCQHPSVRLVEDNNDVLDALTSGKVRVGAGTAWLWSSEDMANSVDVLFVDEASQMSLANTLALSQATTSIVLLGDPQQLDQPQKGIHPTGADVSALGHLMNRRSTISLDQGIFIAETRRLHPDICTFTSELFYDARLLPRSENKNQRLNTKGELDGTGLRFVPVEHFGNQNESPEEADKVADLVDGLLRKGTTWTNKLGETLPLRLEDILIVAPYNAQVSALAERLPAGARTGTVDKFQGQEAPIVFYSMATSTSEDAPRGMEFLYSLNRLNVAISRARCVAVVLASPSLFSLQCKTPRQIKLASAFCRYLEMAHLMPTKQPALRST